MAHARDASRSPRKEVEKLRAEIERHNRLYYEQAEPEISDRVYDRLMDRLIEIEAAHPELAAPDSPSQRVGGRPLEGFATVRHAVPMLSIDNTYSHGEMRDWDRRVRKALNPGETVRYVVELKIDGVHPQQDTERQPPHLQEKSSHCDVPERIALYRAPAPRAGHRAPGRLPASACSDR